MFKYLFIALLLAGCSRSFEDFNRQAEGICRRLVDEFQQVETREDLLKSEVKLRRLFDDLVEVMIASHVYQKEHLDEAPMLNNAYDELLLEEMMRIYRIEGGREIVERAQREALIRLAKKSEERIN